jgi:hypothetical protein
MDLLGLSVGGPELYIEVGHLVVGALNFWFELSDPVCQGLNWHGGGGMKMKRNMGIALLLVLGLSLACSEKHTTDNEEIKSIEDLLVKDNEIAGWTYAGAGWVVSISELYGKINGKAKVYEDHGCIEAAHQTFQGTVDGGTRTLGLTVFDQGNQDNARDTYEDPEVGLSGAVTWTDGAGVASKYARYGGLSQVLAFYNGPYFVLLEMDYDTEESLNILKQFALNVDGKIE